MKRIIILSLFCWPLSAFPSRAAFAQDSINPYIIQQSGTIELHYTNVYYRPFAPPNDWDTRANLCNQSDQLRDSDGLGNQYRDYLPVLYDSIAHRLDTVGLNWEPHGIPLGNNFQVSWQRLFQSVHGDIVAGGSPGDSVVISKNEDVDFRAHGRIILKSGFHAKPGCFFHAYTEPKFDTAVFSDEFDDTAKFRNQWHVNNGWGDYYTQGADCSSDSNVRDTADPDAHDGHALDIVIREVPDTCNCFVLGAEDTDKCESILPTILDTQKFIFSTAILRSCPYPDSQHVAYPFVSFYAHAPYGKYEIREKIPHTEHHTNNWGGGYGMEWDMNETDNGTMSILNPNFNHTFRYGPCKGKFSTVGGTIVFISSQPQWCRSNSPEAIIVNNIPYHVQPFSGHGLDTIIALNDYTQPTWPTSLTSSTDSITFDYAVIGSCMSDTVTWKVDTDAYGKWRIFSAWYHIAHNGDSLRFSKWNQPSKIILTADTGLFSKKDTLKCHWEYNLNNPTDKGLLYLDDTMAPSDIHSFTEAFTFDRRVLYGAHEDYPEPTIPFNGNDTTGGYEYHTFTMELLPHEVRYLYDSVVIRRFPDRLVPPSSPYYDWISQLPRSLVNIRPAEVDIDYGSNDPFGTVPGSITYQERHYFETHLSNPGFWDVTIGGKTYHAAHHLIDYVKVFDVPKDVYIPNYPN